MKRTMFVLLLIGGLVAVQCFADVPPPGIKPADVGSAYACYPSCILPNYIIAEDFDSDGWVDLAVSCFSSNSIWTYKNTGGGIFAVPPNAFGGALATPLGPIALASGVFNGVDGYPDVAVLSTIPATLSGWQFSGGAPAVFPPAFYGVPALLPAPVVHLATGDFDRADGLSDVVVADKGVFGGALPALRFYVSAGAVAPIFLPAGALPTFVVVADFDQNGWDDVAVSCGNNTVQIHYMPALGVAAIDLGAITPTCMDVADFNNDGFPDIVVAGNAETGFAQILLNTVNPANFAPLSAQATWGTGVRFVEALDADGNGWMDFAVANYESHTITVFLTQPGNAGVARRNTRQIVCLAPKAVGITVEPKFKYELQCGYYPTGIASGDFDRNGKVDIAISLYSALLDIDPQVESCIEVIFDVACSTQENQQFHSIDLQLEDQSCKPCDPGPCAGNDGPEVHIQTESDSKN